MALNSGKKYVETIFFYLFIFIYFLGKKYRNILKYIITY